jgi:alcohol dehydrogenase
MRLAGISMRLVSQFARPHETSWATDIERCRDGGYAVLVAQVRSRPPAESPASMPAPPYSDDFDAIRPFDFDPRTRIVFGSGAVKRLGELSREVGGSRVLVVTDHGIERAGHVAHALDSLRAAGLEAVVFKDVQPNPTTEDVDRGLAFAKEHQIDFLVAIGGGSSMDCAKGVNFLLTNGGQMKDYWGIGKATKPMLPLVAIPTTAGTGSEAQSFAIIADAKTHVKMACGDKKAACRVAILDPELTLSMPRGVTAATGIDAISHALESYVTTKRNPISQLFARRSWRLLSQAFPVMIATGQTGGRERSAVGNRRSANSEHEKPRTSSTERFDAASARDTQPAIILAARGAMLLGAHLAGAAIENSMLGATHALANPLTAHHGITHGLAVGLMLPHVIRFNADVVEPLYGRLAEDAKLCAADEPHAGSRLADHVASLVQDAGAPTCLKECGVERSELSQLAEDAAKQWTGTFNPRPVDESSLLELYELAFDPK